MPPFHTVEATLRPKRGDLATDGGEESGTGPHNRNLNFNYNIREGPWGVYPYLASGTIMASDGLVLMRLDLPE